jgi:uncharacterized OB-fold protein
MTESTQRPSPPLTERTGDYWRAGAAGELRIARCQSCGWRLHPPRPICPKCHGRSIAFEPVSGRGVVYAFTINRYRWSPALTPPYVMAEIELEEQEGLRLMSNVVGCAPEDVFIGMPVSVRFEQSGDAWIPVFQP